MLASRALVHDAIERLQRLATLFEQRREALASTVGLTVQQWGVLEEISTEHFMPSMFARRRESSQAAVSKILRQLLDKGLIESSVASTDARKRTYELTARGKSTMAKLRRHREDAVERVWSKLDERSLSSFIVFADQLGAKLSELTQDAAARDH